MRDDEHAALEVLEGRDEAVDRLEVEVVGGLVEQQQVGRRQHHPTERHARLLSAREPGQLVVDLLALEHELSQQRAQLLVSVVGARGGVRESLYDRLVEGERVRLVLLEVLDDGVLGDDLGAALARGLGAEDQAEQSRLACAVGPEDGDSISALEHEVDVSEERARAVAVLHPLHLDDLLGAARRGREAEVEPPPRKVGLCQVVGAALLHLFELPLLLTNRGGGRLDPPELGDVGAKTFDLLLLRLPRGHAEGDALILLLEVGAVVAGVGVGGAELGLYDLGADPVEKLSVVRDDDEGELLGALGEVPLEPLH
mmetsp:Transcript_36883/g.78666  ORF Transcript_36883/g.78666 Transcript_36883/m.78666 type:complete len:313 (+) Transcript_36883:328-1266(+)